MTRTGTEDLLSANFTAELVRHFREGQVHDDTTRSAQLKIVSEPSRILESVYGATVNPTVRTGQHEPAPVITQHPDAGAARREMNNAGSHRGFLARAVPACYGKPVAY